MKPIYSKADYKKRSIKRHKIITKKNHSPQLHILSLQKPKKILKKRFVSVQKNNTYKSPFLAKKPIQKGLKKPFSAQPVIIIPNFTKLKNVPKYERYQIARWRGIAPSDKHKSNAYYARLKPMFCSFSKK